jgi:hypothetical protein
LVLVSVDQLARQTSAAVMLSFFLPFADVNHSFFAVSLIADAVGSNRRDVTQELQRKKEGGPRCTFTVNCCLFCSSLYQLSSSSWFCFSSTLLSAFPLLVCSVPTFCSHLSRSFPCFLFVRVPFVELILFTRNAEVRACDVSFFLSFLLNLLLERIHCFFYGLLLSASCQHLSL